MKQDFKSLYNISEWETLKLNYWGITKSGNTAIKYALHEKADILKSRPINEFTKWVHDRKNTVYISKECAMHNEFDNFTVVRHPVDRFKSMYKDVKRRFKHFFPKRVRFDTIEDFIYYIESTTDRERNIHFKSQSYFITKDDEIVPKIYKLENLKPLEDYLKIIIRHINKIDNEFDLTRQQVDRVRKIFSKDYEAFDYE
jgi:hypothetical protein